MSVVDEIRRDMQRAGTAVRVLSAPPFAFARENIEGAQEYVSAFNDALAAVVRGGNGAFAGSGCVSLGDADASARQIEQIRRTGARSASPSPPDDR